MVTKIPIDGMSREEWLAERRKSLGGSDMGAVLGLNKYRSPYAVWAEKTGLIGEAPDNEAKHQYKSLDKPRKEDDFANLQSGALSYLLHPK